LRREVNSSLSATGCPPPYQSKIGATPVASNILRNLLIGLSILFKILRYFAI